MAEDRDDIRLEAVARAICEVHCATLPDDGSPRPSWRYLIPEARAALQAADAVSGAEGWVLVPREPTRDMKDAANRLNHPRDEEIYAAMIEAAPPPERGDG